MNLAAIGSRIRRDVSRLTRAGALNTVDVIVHYEAALSGEQAAVDPWMESDGARTAQGAARTVTVQALFHEITPESGAQRGFTIIAVGDAILDFVHDAPVEQWRNARFEVDGRWWTQKAAGQDLIAAWDVHVGGKPTVRSILLTPDK